MANVKLSLIWEIVMATCRRKLKKKCLKRVVYAFSKGMSVDVPNLFSGNLTRLDNTPDNTVYDMK